ncbi:hypothetical protein CR513_45625, partial [Mucuna pruriens]
METKERHRMAEVQHTKALKAAEEREEELCCQLAVVKAIVEKSGGEATLSAASTQAFWAQPFNEEIDDIAIPPNFREVVIKPFDGTQDPHTHLQAFHTQIDLATSFTSQLTTNKTKRLEVADLFDI